MPSTATFEASSRTYAPSERVYVVICLDGSSDEYIDAAMCRGMAPNLMRMCAQGWRYRARGVMPSFTNPNNSSIITGVPPSVHGIGGNFFLDPAGRETMMNSGEFLRAPTILSKAQAAGRIPAVVTAKDKLRTILSKGLDVGQTPLAASISSEIAHLATLENSGLQEGVRLAGYADRPNIYSADASVYVLSLGVALVRERRADLLYLSTTDFVQHKYAPDDPEALDFYAKLDEQIGAMDRLGAVVGITADHGMNAKMTPDGRPNIVFLEPVLREVDPGVRVILPITDPYVVHHASLGSFAVIHLSRPDMLEPVRRKLLETQGIVEVLDRDRAVSLIDAPHDRTGDLIVSSARDVVLGTNPGAHDLSKLDGLLRSHGGRSEEMVPLLFNRRLKPRYHRLAQCDPRNFDVFDFTINGTMV